MQSLHVLSVEWMKKGCGNKMDNHYVVVDCRMCEKWYYISATPEQQEEMDKPRSERKFMQDIFPELPIEDRELLISGTCGTCWDKLFPKETEEHDEFVDAEFYLTSDKEEEE